jgi:hypothetical protein
MVVYRERYFIFFYLIIIFKLNACLYERKPRSAEVVNKEIKTDNIHGLLIEGSKLIYCNTNTIQDNFCFHVKKFTIAKNQSFHCDDGNLGITIEFLSSNSPDGKTTYVNHHCYLTDTTLGEYNVIEPFQVRVRCQLIKQYVFLLLKFFLFE